MLTRYDEFDSRYPPQPLRFLGGSAKQSAFNGDPRKFGLTCLPESASQVYKAIDSLNRGIDSLARELNCLGYFGDDESGPTAA